MCYQPSKLVMRVRFPSPALDYSLVSKSVSRYGAGLRLLARHVRAVRRISHPQVHRPYGPALEPECGAPTRQRAKELAAAPAHHGGFLPPDDEHIKAAVLGIADELTPGETRRVLPVEEQTRSHPSACYACDLPSHFGHP